MSPVSVREFPRATGDFFQFPSNFPPISLQIFPQFPSFLPFWRDIFLLEKYITGLKMSRKCSSSSFLPEKILKIFKLSQPMVPCGFPNFAQREVRIFFAFFKNFRVGFSVFERIYG